MHVGLRRVAARHPGNQIDNHVRGRAQLPVVLLAIRRVFVLYHLEMLTMLHGRR